MTTLDEIEEVLLYSGESKQELLVDNVQYSYVLLLIRAVRQLGAMAELEIEDRLDRGFHMPVDDDVLALLEEGR